ncbi:SigE family RNA polymerase sigma factor [Kineosporia succinea]|uniref:RNA polymerase sigma-70 factor (Sigma-E family) n=1 Tax=Kineosporia succinea TaxID=84632 RepID=A0ABT9P7M7_9ACTN|nr:SigE family RNA polymerase sigma factor [Kineosporia succinea]MDP9828467.1 RNA polymerase sigma-70 factor (sigma-E family) [Kineosporia succinea]
MRDEEFLAFVAERRGHLVRTAVLLTAGDRHLAEDLTQTTLTQLYVRWAAFRAARNPDAYVRRCLVNALIDEKRRPWHREQVTEEIPDSVSSFMPFEDADPDVRTEALYAGLRELPPRMRAVLVLRYFHDLNVEETAEALSCSGGTVKSQAARALTKLRRGMSARLSPTPLRPNGAFRA